MSPRGNTPHRRPWRTPERWVYAVALLLSASGAGWLVSHYLFVRHGEFGALPNPWEPWWMRAHGGAMMVFLIAFGALLPGHVAHGLRRSRNAATGVFMLCAVAALTLTGYGLYYAGDGALREWIGIAHWSIGLAVTAAFAAHAWTGRRYRRTRERHARVGARAPAHRRAQVHSLP